MPIFDARPRVLCDTNVIGDLLALSGGDLRNDFIRLARAGVAFHINAYVLDGICYALIADPQQQAEGVRNSGNLGAVDPRQLAALLAALLEPEIPVFPYQHYLYDLVGFGGTPVDQCVAQTRKLTQEYVAWRALMERTAMLDPVLLSVVAEAAGRHNEVRHQYSESIARPPTWKRTGNENDIPALLEQAAPEFARRFDAKYGNTASVRCDALVRSHALLALHQ